MVLARALVALTLTLFILVPPEGGYRNLRIKRLPRHPLRGLTVVIANMTFLTGLATLPLVGAAVIFVVAPLFITALSVPLPGARVGPRRWFATADEIGDKAGIASRTSCWHGALKPREDRRFMPQLAPRAAERGLWRPQQLHRSVQTPLYPLGRPIKQVAHWGRFAAAGVWCVR